MAQFLRPSTDVTITGITGTPDNTNKYANIDETSASDTDYIYSANDTASTYETLTSTGGVIQDPLSSSNHILRYRICMTDAGTPAATAGFDVTVTAFLYQGATLKAQDSGKVVNSATWTTYTYTLSGAEADSITNYSDLRIRLTMSDSSAPVGRQRGAGVSWAELEIPDAPVVALTKPILMLWESDE